MLPVAVILVLLATIQILFQDTNVENDHNVIIEPVLPGINLPASEFGYYSVTLIFCSVVHEIGHALAAVKEDVHLVSVGVTVLFVIPVAYVNISSEKLSSLNAWRTLRILCAGVWHNLVVAAVAYSLYLVAPHIFSLLFYVGNGVHVNNVDSHSPLTGPKGLHSGDLITKINDCIIRDEASWTECLLQARHQKPGFCVNTDLVHSLDESVPIKQLPNGAYDCCGPTKSDWLCFEYVDNNDGILELPPHMCLPARKIIETFSQFCNINKQMCPPNLHCIYPLLPNATTLLKIKRVQKTDVIYIGHPMDVLNTVYISPFIPKHFFTSTSVPDTTMKLLRYVILFSLGFALVNVIPCIYMDGQHITNSLAQIVFSERVQSRHTISLISTIISLCGTVLLFFHCIYTIWTRLLK